MNDVNAPGWYPDSTASSFVWWNGSFYTGQTWNPDPSTELFDVVLLDRAWDRTSRCEPPGLAAQVNGVRASRQTVLDAWP